MLQSVGQASVLTLTQAVDTLTAQNPSLGEVKERETQADEEIPVARSYVLPNISGIGTAYKLKDATNGGFARNGGDPYSQYAAGLKLNQTLFQLGSLTAVDIARKNLDISRLNTAIAKRDLINSLIQSYYQVVLSARTIDILVKQKEVVQDSLKVAQKRQNLGRAQLLDVLQIRTQLALLKGQILSSVNDLSIARTNLANLLGNSESQSFEISDSLEGPDIGEVDSSIDQQQVRIPEIIRNEISIKQIDEQRQVLWGQNLPALNLLGSYSFVTYNEDPLFSQPANSWAVGVQLTIPLFSGLSTVYQNRSLISQSAQLQLEKRNLQEQVTTAQLNSRKSLETARDSIITGMEALSLAEKSMNEARKNFELSTIDYLQYLTIQQQHLSAQQSLNTYKYNYITALGNYYAASGQIMERLVAMLEKANQKTNR